MKKGMKGVHLGRGKSLLGEGLLERRTAEELAHRYTYCLRWSEEDAAFVANAAEWGSIGGRGDSQEQALAEARIAVETNIRMLRQRGEHGRIPIPLWDRTYKGKLLVRIKPALHRQLLEQAAEQGISLNDLVASRLGR
jgi:predicted HicB family RNase H-like nuclease